MNSNPFAQYAATYQVCFVVPYKYTAFFAESLEEYCSALATFEIYETKRVDIFPEDLWGVQLLFEYEPDYSDIKERIHCLSTSIGLESPQLSWNKVDDQDWVSIVQSQAKPQRVGSFYIHPSHYTVPDCSKRRAVCIDAGRAFGTGEHATTQACLYALSWLHRRHPHWQAILDVGCGSGILSIAAVLLFKQKVWAIDIDQKSIDVTHQNAKINNVFPYIRACNAQVKYRGLWRSQRFDLVLANILARPLKECVVDIRKLMHSNGYLVLSGFIPSQMRDVYSVYRQWGFRLERHLIWGGWSALILKRN
jgi:ribosomal protein L11 methyltransferase